MEPDIAICYLTYNVEHFVAQALEGMLMQVCDWTFCIYVFDDASTDNTTAIVKKYTESYPGKIRLYTSEKNLGMMPNTRRALETIKAPYVALCDGDDFWTSANKLQTQVSFLKENPDYILSCHSMNWMDIQQHIGPDRIQVQDCSRVALAAGNFIQTSSVVYRRPAHFKLPEWFVKGGINDYILFMELAKYGKITYQQEPMGVYRLHLHSNWSNLNMVSRHQRFLDTVRLMCRKGHYPADMQKALQRQLKQLVDEWYLMLSSNQQWPLMLTSAARYFSLAPLQSARSAFNGGWQWLMLGYRRMRKWKLQP